MTVDYDAPRPGRVDDTDDGIDAVMSSGTRGRAGDVDLDGTAGPAGAGDRDFLDEEMSVPVVPMRADEFRCGRCFLVHHRSRLADANGVQVCRDCV